MSYLSKLIKKILPNKLKLEGKYFLMKLLKMPYSRSYAPLDVLKWLPKSSPITFFDVGAHAGEFSKSICGEYQIKKGILIEPIARLMPALKTAFPDTKTFEIINAAVSDTSGEADFYFNEDADFVSSLLRIDNKGEAFASLKFNDPALTKTRAVTLDQLTKDNQLQYVDLLKIDVQGAEHLVLKGGAETLKITRLVYTEFSYRPLYADSSTFFELYTLLYQNHFMLVEVGRGYSSPNGELLQGDALFINKALLNIHQR